MAAGAVEAADPLLDGRAVEIDVPDDLPLVRADPVLCERILVNLLHNAARHGAPPIRLEGRVAGERARAGRRRRRPRRSTRRDRRARLRALRRRPAHGRHR